ncbi:MAG: glycosyltransferase family 4 protein [Bacteroidetes bacterium]|nr:glycosyltransferase family 4 protein [Bacteroidota bacterium]
MITGQTQGIVKNISERFSHKKVYWIPNGVDMNYYKADAFESGWRVQNGFSPDDFILLYAGIIGHAQGLEVIIHAAQKLKEHAKIKFVLLGSGPEKTRIQKLKLELKTENVLFLDAVTKKEMPAILSTIDVAVIPLKRLDLFKGAIQSKIFESLAMKKPILLGVEGEAKELFIDEGKCGLAFIPEDANNLAVKALDLYNNSAYLKQLGENGFNYVKQKFTRDQIANNFWDFINSNLCNRR